MLCGGQVLLGHLETGSEDALGEFAGVLPRLLRGRAAERGQRPPAGCPLRSRPLGCGPAVSSLPPCGWKLLPPPRLLRKLLSLSPQVIFHHVALKSWALLGGGRDPLTPSYLWRGDPETSSMSRRGQPFPGGHRSTGTWWPNASVGGGSAISDCRAMKVTGYFLQRVR